jgi:hypothetical protein
MGTFTLPIVVLVCLGAATQANALTRGLGTGANGLTKVQKSCTSSKKCDQDKFCKVIQVDDKNLKAMLYELQCQHQFGSQAHLTPQSEDSEPHCDVTVAVPAADECPK